MQSALQNFGVPRPLPSLPMKSYCHRYLDLEKFPFYNFMMIENEAIENHYCKCQDFIYELSVITKLCCTLLRSKLKLHVPGVALANCHAILHSTWCQRGGGGFHGTLRSLLDPPLPPPSNIQGHAHTRITTVQ